MQHFLPPNPDPGLDLDPPERNADRSKTGSGSFETE